jgi:hypothetical protein
MAAFELGRRVLALLKAKRSHARKNKRPERDDKALH